MSIPPPSIHSLVSIPIILFVFCFIWFTQGSLSKQSVVQPNYYPLPQSPFGFSVNSCCKWIEYPTDEGGLRKVSTPQARGGKYKDIDLATPICANRIPYYHQPQQPQQSYHRFLHILVHINTSSIILHHTIPIPKINNISCSFPWLSTYWPTV